MVMVRIVAERLVLAAADRGGDCELFEVESAEETAEDGVLGSDDEVDEGAESAVKELGFCDDSVDTGSVESAFVVEASGDILPRPR